MRSRSVLGIVVAGGLLAGLCGGQLAGIPGGLTTARAGGPLILDGGFEQNQSGKQLRSREEPQGWYESRGDGKDGRLLLSLSTKKVGGNATHKAMIKASPSFNTYLSQRFSEPQSGRVALRWDVYVKEIMRAHNRGAFQMVGNAAVRGRGPNATAKERFVFLAFENAPRPGKMNLFAFEGKDPNRWDARTLLVPNLDLKKWYTISVEVDIPGKAYMVSIPGVTEKPIRVAAYQWKQKVPTTLTHVSFASWNDGPATFFIDNVGQP